MAWRNASTLTSEFISAMTESEGSASPSSGTRGSGMRRRRIGANPMRHAAMAATSANPRSTHAATGSSNENNVMTCPVLWFPSLCL